MARHQKIGKEYASEWQERYSVYTNCRFQMWSLRLLKIFGSVSLSVGDRFGFMT